MSGPGATGATRRGGSGDDGSASVLAVALVAATVLLLGVVLVLAGAVAARHRAAAAADLAALAAAGAVPGPSACARAAGLASANGARPAGCQVLGDGSVVVEVSVAFRFGRWHGSVVGRARAGRLLRFPTSL